MNMCYLSQLQPSAVVFLDGKRKKKIKKLNPSCILPSARTSNVCISHQCITSAYTAYQRGISQADQQFYWAARWFQASKTHLTAVTFSADPGRSRWMSLQSTVPSFREVFRNSSGSSTIFLGEFRTPNEMSHVTTCSSGFIAAPLPPARFRAAARPNPHPWCHLPASFADCTAQMWNFFFFFAQHQSLEIKTSVIVR